MNDSYLDFLVEDLEECIERRDELFIDNPEKRTKFLKGNQRFNRQLIKLFKAMKVAKHTDDVALKINCSKNGISISEIHPVEIEGQPIRAKCQQLIRENQALKERIRVLNEQVKPMRGKIIIENKGKTIDPGNG